MAAVHLVVLDESIGLRLKTDYKHTLFINCKEHAAVVYGAVWWHIYPIDRTRSGRSRRFGYRCMGDVQRLIGSECSTNIHTVNVFVSFMHFVQCIPDGCE